MEWDQTAELCAVTATDKLKKPGGGRLDPVDFMPLKVKRPARKQSEQEMEARLSQAILSAPKLKNKPRPEAKKKKK